MLVSEAINDIRVKINDTDKVEYTDAELLTNLKEAVQYVGTYLAGARSPLVIEDMNITTSTFSLPANYTMPAGQYPIKITGSQGTLLCTPPLKFRYFATYSNLTTTSQMPYNHEGIWQIMIKLATIYSLNRNEFNIQQDKALLDEINAQLSNIVS